MRGCVIWGWGGDLSSWGGTFGAWGGIWVLREVGTPQATVEGHGKMGVPKGGREGGLGKGEPPTHP